MNKKIKILLVFIILLSSLSFYLFNIKIQEKNYSLEKLANDDYINKLTVNKINDNLETIKINDLGITVDKKKNEELKVEAVENGSKTEKLIQLQKEIEKLRNKKDKLDDELFVMENEIDTYNDIINKNEIEKKYNQFVISRYLKYLYISNNNIEIYTSVFNAKSFSDFLNNIITTEEFLTKMNDYFKKLNINNEELIKNKEELSLKQTLYQEVSNDVDKQAFELSNKEKELHSMLVREEMALFYESLSNSNSLKRKILSYKYGTYSSYYNSSKFMILPVKNFEVTSPWGTRIHPISGEVSHHAGVDLAVDYGTPIVAAADGIVIMSSWYGGYGKAVMINHGNGIVTLYGHNYQLLVYEGMEVKQGQIIALAGSTGNSTGPHCHFEVRYNGDDIDPTTFLIN